MKGIINKVKDKKNKYVEYWSFVKASNTATLQIQNLFAYKEIFFLAKNEYIDPNSNLITRIRNDIDANPSYYPCVKEEVDRALTTIFNGGNYAVRLEKNNLTLDDDLTVFENGFAIFTEDFYNDIANGQINKKLFVDGILKMGQSFKPLAKLLK